MRKREWHSLDDEAKHLVELNQSEVHSILKSYVFPDPAGEEIRVVHVDNKVFPEESVMPIEFAPDPEYRLFHKMLIAMVDLEGPARLTPPSNWGNWENATVIERRRQRRAS